MLYFYDDSYISDITLESEEYNASDDIVVFDCSNLEKINTFVDYGESGRIYGNSKIDDKDYWDNYFKLLKMTMMMCCTVWSLRVTKITLH